MVSFFKRRKFFKPKPSFFKPKPRVFKPRYEDNWKIDDRGIVSEVLLQQLSICWAISNVRGFAALLKIRGLLPPHQQLSIEELVQQMRFCFPDDIFPPDYAIRDLLLAEFILKFHGLVSEEMNPLYYNFESTEEIPLPKEYALPVQKYYIERMELVRAVDFESYEKFEASLVKDLHRCPVACSVKLCPSFYDLTGKQLYDPVNEVMEPGTHSMLLVARGRNEEAKHFLELQDSYGTDVGDDGFVRFRMGNGVITRYVRLTL